MRQLLVAALLLFVSCIKVQAVDLKQYVAMNNARAVLFRPNKLGITRYNIERGSTGSAGYVWTEYEHEIPWDPYKTRKVGSVLASGNLSADLSVMTWQHFFISDVGRCERPDTIIEERIDTTSNNLYPDNQTYKRKGFAWQATLVSGVCDVVAYLPYTCTYKRCNEFIPPGKKYWFFSDFDDAKQHWKLWYKGR